MSEEDGGDEEAPEASEAHLLQGDEAEAEAGRAAEAAAAASAAAPAGAAADDEARPLTEERAEPEAASAAVPNPLGELAAIRAQHHERFREREAATGAAAAAGAVAEEASARREAEERRLAQEREDAELAARLAQEEEQIQQQRLESDEEYSRQLAQQLNNSSGSSHASPAGAGGHSHSYPSNSGAEAAGAEMVPIPLDESDSELGGPYHQMDDEGYRAPMRTGYSDRLIDPAQDMLFQDRLIDPAQDMLFQGLSLPQLLLGAGGGAGREPLARVGDHEAGEARALGLGARCAPLVAAALPVVCIGALLVMLTVLMMQGN
ncbi:unnamed protein product [Prorocentrum cordatum]|uniref:Uncharacterized protein n=1 Tax=Prorocentrum cordatum TaxID=2364126 RepID=A0ABN9Y9R0_9DINO|nr:unnamed protein product [Polarella glacialis]